MTHENAGRIPSADGPGTTCRWCYTKLGRDQRYPGKLVCQGTTHARMIHGSKPHSFTWTEYHFVDDPTA